jgi:uncharacterized cupredoxin-like copper-binding protein
MRVPVTRRFAIAPCVVALAMGGCSPKPSDKAASDASAKPDSATAAGTDTHVVTVTAKDYSFDGPAQISAGLTTFRLVNAGSELHHLTVIRLGEGKTMADVGPAMKHEGAPPPWMTFVGGPNPALPGGGTAEATVMLEPGNYVMMCLIPGADNVPHVAKGMIKPFSVVANGSGASAAATEPKSDLALALSDYKFTVSPAATPGQHIFRVTNSAMQPHEVVLVKLEPGKTGQDVLTWAAKMSGPPPGQFLGGLSPMSPGGYAYFPVNLAPGSYSWMCFVSDAKDGKPHVMHGMVQDFKVS